MIKIRNATVEDLDEIIRLENQIWPESSRAPREKFETRLKMFSQGFFIAYDEKRGLLGVSTSEIVNYNPKNPPTSWEDITDNGWIVRTYIPNGNALYVVSVGSISRSGGGSALVQAQKKLAKKLALNYLVLGSRIPGYNKYCEQNGEIAIEDYVKLVREDGEMFDPELRFYIRNGLGLRKVVQRYMLDDEESREFGAIMDWIVK